MTQQEQKELARHLATLAEADFYRLTCHPSFKRLQAMAAAPRYPEGNEHHIRSIGWQELADMEETAYGYKQHYGSKGDTERAEQFLQALELIRAEQQRRLLKLVPQRTGEAGEG